jgi:hypothetical protein
MTLGRFPQILSTMLLFIAVMAQGQDGPIADEIRAAASDPFDSKLRPLPLAAHWNTGTKADGFGPEYQLSLLDRGYHVLPWFALPVPGEKNNPDLIYYQAAMQRAADRHLPIALISTQWERLLSVDRAYLTMPASTNPNVVSRDGKIEARVSPAGSADPWREVGQRWGSQPMLDQLQKIYPDPPRVLLISNNEHAKLKWKDASQDARLARAQGMSPDELVRLFTDGWKVRYGGLFTGLKEEFISADWRDRSVVMGYNAFLPPSVGRWPGWAEHSLTLPDQLSAWTTIWQGASLPFYTHHWDQSTDFQVWSPQVEAMNWRAAIDALAGTPYWIELSTWDGNRGKENDKRLTYEKLGQTYGPDRYEGMVQFGLWLIQPRTLREFRAHNDRKADYAPYFQAVLRSVERVHRVPELREFWQRGRLLPNGRRHHPYQSHIPNSLARQPRWFGLSTSRDEPGPWKLDTPIAVFAIAHLLGEKPNRRWLVYAHAPVGPSKKVTIDVPDFSGMEVDVPRSGGFWLIEENPPAVRAIDTSLSGF